VEFLFPWHPRVVHFPMALLLIGAAFTALGLWRGRPAWREHGRLSLLLGWLSTLAAVMTGLIDQSRAAQSETITAAINQHITVGLAVLVAFGLALYWPLRDKKLCVAGRIPWPYLALLLVGVALVLAEGWLGGKLVYELGVGVK
jgi:uncharacterized membrane protein